MSGASGLKSRAREVEDMIHQLDHLNVQGRRFMIDRKCEKQGCGAEVPYSNESRVLFGDVTVTLCGHHLREWEVSQSVRTAVAHDAYLCHEAHYIEMSAAGPNPIPLSKLNEAFRKRDLGRARMRRITLLWLGCSSTVDEVAEESE